MTETSSAMLLSDEQLAASMKHLLSTCDLSVTTLKSLISQLEEQYGVPLKEKKQFFTTILNEFIDSKTSGVKESEPAEQQGDDWSDSDDDTKVTEKTKKNKNNMFNAELQLSDDLSEFMGTITSSRPNVTKKMWAYIKDKQLQNPKDRREIICDETLFKVFKRKKLTMFSMNKFLAPMMKDIASLQDGPSKTYKTGKKIKPALKSQQESNSEESDSEKESKRPTRKRKAMSELPKVAEKKSRAKDGSKPRGFCTPCLISPQLQAFLGEEKSSRPQATSKLWAYIKEHGLQNPSDKREILFDDTLKALFKVNKVKMFGLAKLLSQHVFSSDHVDTKKSRDDDDIELDVSEDDE